MMHQNGPIKNQTGLGGNQFMQQMHFTKNAALNAVQKDEYEYDIDLPAGSNPQATNVGESVGSNPGSVIGNYPEGDPNKGS